MFLIFGIRTPCTTTGCFISSSTKSQMATSAQNFCPLNKMTYMYMFLIFGIRTPCTTTGCFISSSTKSQMATSAQNCCPLNKMTYMYIISITMKVFYIWPCYWHDQNCAAISLPHQHLLSRRMGKQSRKNVQVIQFGSRKSYLLFWTCKKLFRSVPKFPSA